MCKAGMFPCVFVFYSDSESIEKSTLERAIDVSLFFVLGKYDSEEWFVNSDEE